MQLVTWSTLLGGISKNQKIFDPSCSHMLTPSRSPARLPISEHGRTRLLRAAVYVYMFRHAITVIGWQIHTLANLLSIPLRNKDEEHDPLWR